MHALRGNTSSTGFAKYNVIVGTPGGVDDSDVRFTFRLTDVRHQGTLADYTGELQTGGAPGAICGGTTTLDAIVPGTIKETKRTIWQLDRVRVNDGGADGVVSTDPNTVFAVQGVFIP